MQKEAMDLKESTEGCVGSFREQKGGGEVM